MGHNSLAPLEFSAPKHIQMKKKHRDKQNETGLKITRLVLLLKVFRRKKSELLVLHRPRFASGKLLKKSSKKLFKSRPEKTNKW